MLKERNIHKLLIEKYPNQVSRLYPFPKAYKGPGNIKAIVLGADPTHIINDAPKPLNMVFELDSSKSPYWNSIGSNLSQLKNLSMDNLYVQNVCRNYFNEETSKNKQWAHIAREFWLGHLRKELNGLCDSNIPVLMTTEFILKAALNDGIRLDKANNIYKNCITIAKEDNLLQRELIAFYRHPRYLLRNWVEYRAYINNKF